MSKLSKTIILFILILILGITTSCYAVDLDLTDSDDLTSNVNTSSNESNTNSSDELSSSPSAEVLLELVFVDSSLEFYKF